MKYLTNIGHVALRELDIIIRKNRIYGFCMVVFPVLLVFFFTTMLDDGVALDLPVGVVDQDNSSMSRGLTRNLDAMQSSRVVYRFANVTEARNAMQEGKVYAYLLIPEGTAAKLLSGRQPKISYYYTMTCMTAGSMAMKDMKTIGSLGSAAVGQSTLAGKGASPQQIKAALQPVTVDAHMIANPQGSYIQHRRGYSRQVHRPRVGIPACDILLPVLYFRSTPFPQTRWRLEHRTSLSVAGGWWPWLRHLCLWPDALAAHVDEHLFAVVGALHLHVRLSLPHCGNGCSAAGHVMAFPPASLLDDLSGHRPQRIPRHRRLVPPRGTRGLHAAALVRTP